MAILPVEAAKAFSNEAACEHISGEWLSTGSVVGAPSDQGGQQDGTCLVGLPGLLFY